MHYIKLVAVAVVAVGSLWLATPASALNFIQPAGSPYATGELESNSVLTGDLNGDGRDDLVTVNADYSYSVFLANADGSLTPTLGNPFSTGSTYALSGTLVDFTDDGNLDLAIATNNEVIVRPGNGAGGFGAALPTINTVVNGEDITSGLVNDDDIPDLVVAGWSTDRVSILFGNGSGGILGTTSLATAAGPVSVAVADFTGDGLGDIATANLGGQSGQATTVLINTADGFFDRDDYDGTYQPRGVAVGDFNDDGDKDLVQVARSDSTMQLLYGDGNGGFVSGSSQPNAGSSWVNSVATADFDEDGFDDAVIGRSSPSSAPVFLGNPGTTLALSPDGPWATTSPSSPWTVAAGDFNDDGHVDWVSGDQGGRMSVFLNDFVDQSGITIDPASHDFGDTPVGTAVGPQEFTVTSSGATQLLFGPISLTGADSDQFALTGTSCGPPLAPGQTCTVSVSFNPTSTGAKTASLSFVTDAPGSPQTVSLSGSGIDDADIAITPASHDFGDVGMFSAGTPQVFSVESTGTTELEIASVSLAGTNPNQFTIDGNDCGATLQPEETCEVTVNYRPTEAGSKSAALSFATNAPDAPQTAAISGTGRFPEASFTPDPLDFGPVPLNTGPSSARTVAVEATGTVDLEIEEVSIYMDDFADFSITGDECTGVTLKPGETCDVDIDFEPGALGERNAMLRIGHLSGVILSPVEGEGVNNPGFTLTPASHDFGTRLTDDGPGAPQAFTLTSTGTTELDVRAVSLAGAAADQFQISADGCSNQALAPEASCEISIVFSPTTAGEKVAGLSVALDGGVGPAAAQLTGSGQDPVPPPDPCEPVAVKKVAYFTPNVKKRSNIPGLRARITTAGPADVRISSKVIYHLNGKQGSVNYKQRQFRVTTDSLNYKVAIPKNLRKQLRPKKQVRFVVTYASKSTNPECTKFGEEKTRNLTTRVVWVIPNG